MNETPDPNAQKGKDGLSPQMKLVARAGVGVLIAIAELAFSMIVVGVSRALFGAASIKGTSFLTLCAIGVVFILLRRSTPQAPLTMQERLRWAIARLVGMLAAQTAILHYWP